jgi:LCP family protein required for cell wall assembly
MLKKLSKGVFFLGILITILYGATTTGILPFKSKPAEIKPFLLKNEIVQKIENQIAEVKNELPGDKSIFKGKDIINILLIGIDRRNKSQTGFNTDVMIMLSINFKTKKVLLTSVPRDLWINGNKINALYTVFGYDTLKDAFEKITGMPVDGYIRCDFEDFRWLADSMGGIPVNVERTFTDETFPNNSDTGILTVTFNEGIEVMTGDRALTFARSRKGNNGEGSDLMRAKRQHILLKGILEGVNQKSSTFYPMNVESFFNTVISANRMLSTLSLDDAYYLWRFYDQRGEFQIESFVVNDKYIYHPGMYPQSEYHAWVFVPRDPTFGQLQNDVKAKLDGTYVDPDASQTTETTNETSKSLPITTGL